MSAMKTIMAGCLALTLGAGRTFASDEAGTGAAETGAGQEIEMAAYLGISTAPVGETLGDHLDIPEGAGVVVQYIDPESRAAGNLKKHDILWKLDDQILVNHDQLAALIRMRKPGDEAALGIIRHGKHETVKVRLGEKELPLLSRMRGDMPRIHFALPDMSGMTRPGPSLRMNSLRPADRRQGGGLRIENRSTTSAVTMTHGDNTYTLATYNNGEKRLTVTDGAGRELFGGKVNAKSDRDAVPESFRSGFEQVERISGRIDNDNTVPADPAGLSL